MRTFIPCVFAIFLGIPAQAQVIEGNTETFRLTPDRIITEFSRQIRIPVNNADAAFIRGLDKMSGRTADLALESGQQADFERLTIQLHECRYPRNNPTGDAFARLTIRDQSVPEPVFDGWMIASSPAMIALDHPRYDIWVIRCKLDDRIPSVVAGRTSPRPLMRP